MEKSRRLSRKSGQRGLNDISRPHQPRMGMAHITFELQIHRPQPLIDLSEKLTTDRLGHLCYRFCMSKILEQALERAKSLPVGRQDEIGRWIMDVVDQDRSDLQLSKEQIEEVERRVNEPNPIFATDEQVKAFFSKFAI